LRQKSQTVVQRPEMSCQDSGVTDEVGGFGAIYFVNMYETVEINPPAVKVSSLLFRWHKDCQQYQKDCYDTEIEIGRIQVVFP